MIDDLDPATAARELSVGVDYLEALLASGKLRDVGAVGARRVRRDDLLAFKAARAIAVGTVVTRPKQSSLSGQ